MNDIDKEIALFEKELKIENPNSKKAIVDKLQFAILDLNQGFGFVGTKQRVELSDTYFYVNLVYYNRILKSFVLINFKNGNLNTQDMKRMNLAIRFYDEKERMKTDNKTVGILIGNLKNDLVVEYVLNKNKNVNLVSQYETVLPNKEKLKELLSKY